MNILFPKLSIGKAKVSVPKLSNPFTSKKVTLRVPVLKVRVPKLKFRNPFTKA